MSQPNNWLQAILWWKDIQWIAIANNKEMWEYMYYMRFHNQCFILNQENSPKSLSFDISKHVLKPKHVMYLILTWLILIAKTKKSKYKLPFLGQQTIMEEFVHFLEHCLLSFHCFWLMKINETFLRSTFLGFQLEMKLCFVTRFWKLFHFIKQRSMNVDGKYFNESILWYMLMWSINHCNIL